MSRFEDYIKTIAPNIHIPSYAKRFENIVEVVRCKDCKFWHAEGQYCDKFGVLWDEFYTSPNDYCSRGERREDGLLVTD